MHADISIRMSFPGILVAYALCLHCYCFTYRRREIRRRHCCTCRVDSISRIVCTSLAQFSSPRRTFAEPAILFITDYCHAARLVERTREHRIFSLQRPKSALFADWIFLSSCSKQCRCDLRVRFFFSMLFLDSSEWRLI